MIALLLAATIALPPGVLGEWSGSEPGQKATVYRTGLDVRTGLNPHHPDTSFGWIGRFETATSDPRHFIASCGADCHADVIFHDDGSLEIRVNFVDLDAVSVGTETYRFTREGLSDT